MAGKTLFKLKDPAVRLSAIQPNSGIITKPCSTGHHGRCFSLKCCCECHARTIPPGTLRPAKS